MQVENNLVSQPQDGLYVPMRRNLKSINFGLNGIKSQAASQKRFGTKAHPPSHSAAHSNSMISKQDIMRLASLANSRHVMALPRREMCKEVTSLSSSQAVARMSIGMKEVPQEYRLPP